MSGLTIGKVAKAAGLGVETVRFYEREGLIPNPTRTASGYRVYPVSNIDRLRFVRRAKRLGFTLAEIRNLLRISDGDGSAADVKTLAQEKLQLVEQRIEELNRVRDALQGLSERCPGSGCVENCPIIHALANDEELLEAAG